MATFVSQHVRHIGFFNNFIFSKNAANFLEVSRKHVFTASNTNIIKNKVEKEIKTNFAKKLQFSLSKFSSITNST